MTRTIITTVLLILFFNFSYSQKKYDLDIYGGPLNSYRVYKSNDYIDPNFDSQIFRKGKDYFDKVFQPETNELEKATYGYMLGIKASYNITEKINLNSGFEFSSIGEKADYGLSPIYKEVDYNGTPILLPSSENYHLIMTYTYNYLSIPISIRYNLVKFKNISINPSVGLHFDFLLDKQVDNTSENKEIYVPSKINDSSHEFRFFSGAFSINLEFNYSISNKVQLYLSPNIKQYYLPNEIVTPKYHIIGGESYIFDKINKYNYTIGLNTGIRLKNIFNR